ncbi:OmpP1/FadL family transporter [Daejeonella oryzae]|uniref:OmpP1/FadL family transporter n=1 Tax=Daejeonella oryzae TaxID=1122943 RepID=UPI00047BA6AB|nr:outer membrane protein transport protein [Daejeonella oryzae]
MRFRILLTAAIIVAAAGSLHAQYSADALRFSINQAGSTARFNSLAGAQTGVGGDLSSVNGNPAGIGLFTKSEFSLTPEFNNYKADALYLGGQTIGNKDKINLNHAAIVWHMPFKKQKGSDLETGWISSNYGISFSKDNDFNNNISYSGINGDNSIADYFAELASNNYGSPSSLPSGTLERMAYDNYLIGYDSQGYFPETDVNNEQTRLDSRKGTQSEVTFAAGANYSNKFYIGVSLGLASINYTSDAEYIEKGFNVTENNEYELSYRQNQFTEGTGINGKVGVLFRPNSCVRLGATVETPTWYTFDDSYNEVLNTQYGSTGLDSQFVNNSETYNFSYKLRTPLKLTGGIGIFLNNQGFISADVDYVDYSQINFSAVDNMNSDIIADNNREIRNNYRSAVNYRLGGEYKIENIMLRAGYGRTGSPYKETVSSDALKSDTFSGGLGYRINNYYIDLAYQNVTYNSSFKPYTLAGGTEPTATIKNTRNNIFLTIGSRF